MVRLTTSDSEKSQTNVSVPREKRAVMWLRGTAQPSVGPVITASPSTRTIKKFFVTIFIWRRRTKVTDDDGIQTRARRIRLCRVGDSADASQGVPYWAMTARCVQPRPVKLTLESAHQPVRRMLRGGRYRSSCRLSPDPTGRTTDCGASCRRGNRTFARITLKSHAHPMPATGGILQ